MKRILIILTGAAWLIACNKKDSPANHVFRYNESAGISTLDPAFAKNLSLMWPTHQLYSTLLEIDNQLHLKPLLAKSWSVDTMGLTYTFVLRTDVYFHDDPVFQNGIGRKLVAKDVVYSFSRLIDPLVASPGAWIFHNKVDDSIPFLALNDSTLQIRLKKSYSPFLKILSMPYCSVVAPEAVAHYGKSFRRHPVGTGPFQWVAWEEGRSLVLKRNSHYFEKDQVGRQLPYLKGIQVSFMENKTAEFLAFQQGAIDFINDIDPSFKDELLSKTGQLKKEWQGKAVLHKSAYLNTEYLGILADSSKLPSLHPLRQPLVRRAISLSIDKEKMLLYLRNNAGTPAWKGFVPPVMMSTILKSEDHYDPVQAKLLLKKAGYDAVHPMASFALVTVPSYTALGSFIVNELNQVGFNCQLEIMQKGLLLQKMAAGQVYFFRGSWIADYPDPSNYMSVFYSQHPAPPNYTRYRNPQFDSLYEATLQLNDDGKRTELFLKMNELLCEDLPVIPMWYDQVIHLSQPNLFNFQPNVFNMLELRTVKK